LGLKGSGYSTSIARFYMAGVLLAAVAWRERQAILRISWRWNAERIRRLAGLGFRRPCRCWWKARCSGW